jgi:hypothetical protein
LNNSQRTTRRPQIEWQQVIESRIAWTQDISISSRNDKFRKRFVDTLDGHRNLRRGVDLEAGQNGGRWPTRQIRGTSKELVKVEPPSGSTIRVEHIPKSTANPEMIAITMSSFSLLAPKMRR